MPLLTFHDTTPANKTLAYTVHYLIIPEQPDCNETPGTGGAVEITEVWFEGKRARVGRELRERMEVEIRELEGVEV